VEYQPKFKDENFVVYTKDGYQMLSPGKNYIGHYSPSQALDGYGNSLKSEIEKARAYAAVNPALKIQSSDYDDIFRPVPVYRGTDVDSQNAGHLGITLQESTSGPRMTPRSAEINNYPPGYDLNNEADDTFRHELRHSGQAAILDDDIRGTYSISPSKLKDRLGGAAEHGLSQAEQLGWAGGLQQEIFKLTGKRLESQAEARDFLDKATRATPEQLERAYPVQNREILRGINWLKSLRQKGSPEESAKALDYMSRILPALVDNSSQDQASKTAAMNASNPGSNKKEASVDDESRWKLYYFEGRNTGIAARSEAEARQKKRRGGDILVAVREPDSRELQNMEAGRWVRTRADGKPPGSSDVEGRGQGPAPKNWKESVIELQNKRRSEAVNASKTAAFDAPRPTTIGRLMFESIVPANYRGAAVGGDDELTANKIDSILEQVAHRDPGAYKEISHKLLRLGVKGSVETNTSFSLDDLESPVNKIEIIRKVRAEEDKINSNRTLSQEEKQQKLLDLYRGWGERLPEMVFNEAMNRESGLAKMVASGARGSKGQLNSNIGADFAVSDSQGNQLPIPIEHSYSEGLTPAEYFAASYGTRLGLIATKFSVQDGGYFSKQLNAAAGDLIIVEEKCKSTGGLPTDPMDKENIGSVLANDFGSVKAGTVITPKVMDQLKRGVKGDRTQIVVRSPITCTAKGGGICAQCAGVRENNRFLDIGENIGVNAASGLAEPVQQALLSTKHSAGVASAGGASQVRGFPQIDALAQIPDKYPSGASLAGLDGRITSIDEAPQGGAFVTVGEKQHYVPPGLGVKVKKGQEVEAGDILSEGIPNPGEVTKYKGVGAGRVYFVSAFLEALKDNGTKADRRNTEVLSRALVNHVRVGDDFESNQFMPDEVVEYSAFAEKYVPPQDTAQVKPDKSLGMYIQKPVLQYSVGTRITPSVIKQFHSAGVEDVSVSSTEPSFSSEMVRALDNPAYKDDFMTHTGQSYVKRNLMSDVQSGRAHSELHGKYFAPALAKGVEFGRPPAGVAGY
jgi:hypothetical protein